MLVCEVHISLATQWRYSSLAGSDLGSGASEAVITASVICISGSAAPSARRYKTAPRVQAENQRKGVRDELWFSSWP